MRIELVIPLLLFPFLLAAFAVMIARILKKRNGQEYNFRQYFPFELFEGQPRFIWPIRVVEGIGEISTSAFFFYLFSSVKETYSFDSNYALALLIVNILLSLSWLAVSFIPLKLERLHVNLFFVYSLALTLFNILGGSVFLSIYRHSPYDKLSDLFFAIIGFILAFLSFLPVANPSLKKYASYEVKQEENGEAKLVRPRFFVMAASEWYLFFLRWVSFLLAGLFFLLAK